MNTRCLAALAASALLVVGCSKSAGASRTVSGAVTTVYAPLGGTETVLATPPPEGYAVTAALFPEADGYRTVPLQLDASYAFSAAGVPAGRWFLALERPRNWRRWDPDLVDFVPVAVKELAFVELSADRPDLSVVSAARPDLARQSSLDTAVSLSLTGLEPWASGSRLVALSADADFALWLYTLPPPAPVEGAWSGTAPWAGVGSGLPAAGDDVYAFQRTQLAVGTGADPSTAAVATRVGWSDALAFSDGSTNGAAFDLQVGSAEAVSFDVRTSEFTALAGQVWPGQSPGAPGPVVATVTVTPGPTSFPDQPTSRAEVNVAILTAADATADHVYDFAYAAPVPSSWGRFRRSGFSYGSPGGLLGDAAVLSIEPWSDATRPIAPALGPPTAPRIEGRDLSAVQVELGTTTPVISWSPPATGTPTHYEIAISRFDFTAGPGDPYLLVATVRGTSFRVPAGFLTIGGSYLAKITAVAVAGDDLDAPFRHGTPRHSADRVTEVFAP